MYTCNLQVTNTSYYYLLPFYYSVPTVKMSIQTTTTVQYLPHNIYNSCTIQHQLIPSPPGYTSIVWSITSHINDTKQQQCGIHQGYICHTNIKLSPCILSNHTHTLHSTLPPVTTNFLPHPQIPFYRQSFWINCCSVLDQ